MQIPTEKPQARKISSVQIVITTIHSDFMPRIVSSTGAVWEEIREYFSENNHTFSGLFNVLCRTKIIFIFTLTNRSYLLVRTIVAMIDFITKQIGIYAKLLFRAAEIFARMLCKTFRKKSYQNQDMKQKFFSCNRGRKYSQQ